MDEARVNGSGANDPTAYQAISRAEGTKEVYPGDIWRTENAAGRSLIVLVIAVSENICIGLNLQDDVDCSNRVAVDVNGRMMATNCAMVSFRFNNLLTEMIGTITAPKLESIRRRVGDVLEIPTDDQDLRDELAKCQAMLKSKGCESQECARDWRQEKIDRLRCEFELQKKEIEIATLRRQIEALETRIIDNELQRL